MRLALIALAIGATALGAQNMRPDSARTLSPIVVVAERSATPLNRSTAAVTRVTAREIAASPNASLADVLRLVPGFAVVDFDGLGRDPQVMARGFYGGGEAEYVVVLVDGRPMNRLHNGTVPWDALPSLSAIESVEIVRGSASAAHGDAAVGGVINIVTRRGDTAGVRWLLGGGSRNTGTAAADLTATFAGRPASASGSFDRTSGFRDHASRSTVGARGTVELSDALRLTARGSWRDFDEPGPLLEDLAAANRAQSDPLFEFDHATEQDAAVVLEGQRRSEGRRTLRASLSLEQGVSNAVRTIALAPGIGDTKERQLDMRRGRLDVQLDAPGTASSPFEQLTVGGALEIGDADSHYYDVDASGGRGDLEVAGNAARGTASVFAHASMAPVAWLRWTLCARADWLFDSYHREGQPDLIPSHAAISPKAGVNLRYASGGRSSGHAYLAASRTFKAPTLDQLFDQRPIPIPFPPFSLTTSNPDLAPQRGTSLEAGLYHDLVTSSARWHANVSAYQVAMRDEIDFDLQTFTYMNIARSRHRGVEAGLTAGGQAASAFVTLALQEVVAQAGDHAGKRLKAVPGTVLSTGVMLMPYHGERVSISLTRASDMFVDDANTRRLQSWTRVDGQVAHTIGSVDIIVGARNLLNAKYHSTGYLDPSGSGMAYCYPAAGRTVTLGVRHGR